MARAALSTLLRRVVCLSTLSVILQLGLFHHKALEEPIPGNYSNAMPTDKAIRRLSHHDNASSLLIFTGNDCVCDLISVDCLDSVRCIPKSTESMIASGVMTRRAIKDTTVFKRKDRSFRGAPIGKGFQYTVIEAWKRWMEANELPIRYTKHKPSIFVNETWYKECRKRNVQGKGCFFQSLNAPEDLYDLEEEALANTNIPVGTLDRIATNVQQFRKESQRMPSLAHLLYFAHIARIRFNLASFVSDIYKNRLESVIHHKPKSRQSSNIRVALHMRRADACLHRQDNFTTMASPLDSPAQTTNVRHCYATSVYLDALKRVASRYETVDVYLSTDYAGSVIEEIKSHFGAIYKRLNWHFLNYYKDNVFKYTDMVESDFNDAMKQAMLGESAIADLYHLSHGQVFIGHLGSRFGKVSWLLATARHNAFVPFFTVDGHSFCCEIDEACGEMKPYITTMENCMTYAYELGDTESEGDYWTEGSTARRTLFEREQKATRRKSYWRMGSSLLLLGTLSVVFLRISGVDRNAMRSFLGMQRWLA